LADFLGRDTAERVERRPTRHSGGTSYAFDIDTSIVGEYLDSDMTCGEAATKILQRLVMRQRVPTSSTWSYLRDYLFNTMPNGSRVRDCNQTMLASCLQRLEAGVA
jgi:hypothetical protein